MADNLSLPQLVYHSFRRDQLCVPQGCDDAVEVRDELGFLVRRDRCSTCPLEKLDDQIVQKPVLHRAFDLDFSLTCGIKITLDEIDVEEFRALKSLRSERDKYQAELTKNDTRNR